MSDAHDTHPVRPQPKTTKQQQVRDVHGPGGVLCPLVGGNEDGGGEGRKRARSDVDTGSQEEANKGEEEEARAPMAPPIPITPSLKEVLEHRLTHLPYRSWCPHCVRGKGRNDRHGVSGQKGIDLGIPKVVSDYFFIGRRRPARKEERAK